MQIDHLNWLSSVINDVISYNLVEESKILPLMHDKLERAEHMHGLSDCSLHSLTKTEKHAVVPLSVARHP